MFRKGNEKQQNDIYTLLDVIEFGPPTWNSGCFKNRKKGTTFSSCCCVLQSGFREFVFLSPIFYLAVTTMLRVVSGRVRLDYYLY